MYKSATLSETFLLRLASVLALTLTMFLPALARRAGFLLRGPAHRLSAVNPRIVSVANLSTSPPTDKPRTMDEVQGLFAESLLLLADAQESRETTYFVEDYADAKEGVQEALDAYSQLLEALPEDRRKSTREANDPKFNQLREQFSVLEESLIHED